MPDLHDRRQRESEMAAALLLLFDDYRDQWPDIDWQRFRDDVELTVAPHLAGTWTLSAEQLRLAAGFDGQVLTDVESATRWAQAYSRELARLIVQNTQGMASKAAGADVVFGQARADLIAASETTRAVTAGEYGVLTAAVSLGIMPYSDDVVIWYTADDERVCPYCMPLHQQPRSVWSAEAPYGPPLHPRCRCWLEYGVGVSEAWTDEAREKSLETRRARAKLEVDETKGGRRSKKGEEEVSGRNSIGGGSAAISYWAAKRFENPDHAKAFTEWFGDSKVVNEKGEPLVVYHGTRKGEIIAFRNSPVGIFFTDSHEDAAMFSQAIGRSRQSAVMATHLSISNPATIDYGGKLFNRVSFDRTVSTARRRGYDGVIATNIVNVQGAMPSTTYIAFSPSQIKSATGNRGTFDPNSSDIRESYLTESTYKLRAELDDYSLCEVEEAWTDEAREKSLETRRARAKLEVDETKGGVSGADDDIEDLPDNLQVIGDSGKVLPAAGKSRITVKERDEEATVQVKRLFGNGATVETVGSLFGAPDGSGVTLSSNFNREVKDFGLYVSIYGDNFMAERRLYRDGKGALVCVNDQFMVTKQQQGSGLGAKMFSSQVDMLAKAGVSRIDTSASRYSGTDQDVLVGYKVWPKLGYDGPLAKTTITKLPPALKSARTVQQLYSTPAGKAWWEKNGNDIDLSFDLKPNSNSRKVLNAYLARKRSRAG
jgi:hypothetical protein